MKKSEVCIVMADFMNKMDEALEVEKKIIDVIPENDGFYSQFYRNAKMMGLVRATCTIYEAKKKYLDYILSMSDREWFDYWDCARINLERGM